MAGGATRACTRPPPFLRLLPNTQYVVYVSATLQTERPPQQRSSKVRFLTTPRVKVVPQSLGEHYLTVHLGRPKPLPKPLLPKFEPTEVHLLLLEGHGAVRRKGPPPPASVCWALWGAPLHAVQSLCTTGRTRTQGCIGRGGAPRAFPSRKPSYAQLLSP